MERLLNNSETSQTFRLFLMLVLHLKEYHNEYHTDTDLTLVSNFVEEEMDNLCV